MITDMVRSGSDFWINYDYPQPGKGYGQFSIGHLILVLCSSLLITAIIVIYKKHDEAGRIRMRRVIALMLVIIETVRLTFLYLQGIEIIRYLPLEVCSFAGYTIICDAIWPKNRFLPEMLVTIFLPAAIMQHISPSTTILPLCNYFTFSQFLYHGLIIGYALARFLNGEIRLTYRGVWASIAKIFVLATAVYILNSLIGENFMFLMDPEGNYLLEKIYRVAGGGIRYTLGLVAFAAIMIHVFFVFFRIIDALFVRRRTAVSA